MPKLRVVMEETIRFYVDVEVEAADDSQVYAAALAEIRRSADPVDEFISESQGFQMAYHLEVG